MNGDLFRILPNVVYLPLLVVGLICSGRFLTMTFVNFRSAPFRCSVFFVAMLSVSGSACAEWILLGRNENFRVYVDNQSLQRNGETARALQLMDFTSSQWVDSKTVVWSMKTVIEYSCVQPSLRTLTLDAYSEQMGEGRVVSTEKFDSPAWESFPSGTPTEKLWRIACEKK